MKHLPGSLKYRIALALALVILAGMLGSQPAPREQVGPLPGGGFLLNSGWRLDPVGKQVPLDTLPMSTALSPDGKYLLVLNGGYRPPSHQRDRDRLGASDRQCARGRWLAGPGLLAQGRPRLRGRRLQGLAISNSPSPMATSRPRAPSRWCRRPSAARRISSAMWPSRPMAACSMRPTFITTASRW